MYIIHIHICVLKFRAPFLYHKCTTQNVFLAELILSDNLNNRGENSNSLVSGPQKNGIGAALCVFSV